jgi:hypothetical protein
LPEHEERRISWAAAVTTLCVAAAAWVLALRGPRLLAPIAVLLIVAGALIALDPSSALQFVT